ncbi:kinase [Allocoprobacillus halotolerans]|uniref:Kinase n=1 Tax=Allocoprobacillus halotolerans TaxID=2944914 RepID=A0ABY5I5D3_9FIRM|nr:kinase [Allocoprobacillus halotolerans]UTY40568.1 kinase [Allocoprobacillus halotolerans]
MKTYHLQVNGHPITVKYHEQNINDIFIPLLQRWTQMQKEKQSRLLVLLAAPPGAGKSTLSLFLEYLSHQDSTLTPIQTIGMDGFHRYQNYLDTHFIERDGKTICMKDVKGCPETFDVEKLIQKSKKFNSKTPIFLFIIVFYIILKKI